MECCGTALAFLALTYGIKFGNNLARPIKIVKCLKFIVPSQPFKYP
jgi:hypothetical protein